MHRREAKCSRLHTGSNPDRSFASDQRKRVFAEQLPGTFELEAHRIVCVRPNIAELVIDSQNDSGRVGAIRDAPVAEIPNIPTRNKGHGP